MRNKTKNQVDASNAETKKYKILLIDPEPSDNPSSDKNGKAETLLSLKKTHTHTRLKVKKNIHEEGGPLQHSEQQADHPNQGEQIYHGSKAKVIKVQTLR